MPSPQKNQARDSAPHLLGTLAQLLSQMSSLGQGSENICVSYKTAWDT